MASGTSVQDISSQGNGYIKFGDGTMIQWGTGPGKGGKSYGTLYFSVPFKKIYSATVSGSANHWDSTVNYSYSTSGISLWIQNESGVGRVNYTAFGTWK